MTLEIQVRRDTAANWAAANPVLHAGEPSFETDTHIHKIGDGSTAYNSLPGYADANVTTTTDTQTMTNKRITARSLLLGSTGTPATSPTPTIDTDNYDVVHIIQNSADNITSMSSGLSGTPVEGDLLAISFTCSVTTLTIAWGASFENSSQTLPTSLSGAAASGGNYRLDVTLAWNTETSKWRCLGAV